MTRHRFDPVSLVLGLAVLGAGIAAVAGWLGELINEPGAFVPIALGLVGLALIGSVRRPPARLDADGD